ncbi:unnamed protein product (macronuclear) [Paramecium tetraurelia]|uniref:inositol-3-phosphate synthase n=1 Tax=Paramecium tetraurelia TaxID=5888 RepID=A0E9W3_PARTE|nr:uncharacterized protein GSPATT00024811001 [Paramecium tetraurelia]CAK92080.1 unnamed protein product [Paramecium tetraurelia]|eukprot:XP_001459477.1 hypothetical protein (macronuclear) [Paramecium tetraurelia strain d4-2]
MRTPMFTNTNLYIFGQQLIQSMKVQSTTTQQDDHFLIADYDYKSTNIEKNGDKYIAKPQITNFKFKTDTRIPKVGVMLVGWGGNNGTTLTGGILANKFNITWNSRRGTHQPNFYGSLTQSSVIKIGTCNTEEVFVPFKDVLPMVNPCDIVFGGWDISSLNLADAMGRAQVVDYDLQQKLRPYLEKLVPLPSIYYPDFIAANQGDRADNVIPGNNKLEHLNTIRKNIADFKQQNNLDKVILLWTANTERFCVEDPNVHGTAEKLMKSIESSHPENQCINNFCMCCLFRRMLIHQWITIKYYCSRKKAGVFVAGDDFKTGQTKFKTCLVEYLVGAGIKPKAIISYNHLGNNDGKNLSQESCFKSKERSKKTCVDDILESNKVLYPTEEELNIDHTIVIKYCPETGDSKKAMDEYIAEIFLGGRQTFAVYNVCEDSLLAAPLIMDLLLLCELFERIQFSKDSSEFQRFDTVLSWLSYLMKAPKSESGITTINALSRQRAMLENLVKVCAGLTVDDNLRLEVRYGASRFQQ